MSQCVPSWDNNQLTDTYNDLLPAASTGTKQLVHGRDFDSNVVPGSAPQVPMWLDYEVAELTWENGQLGLHGLGQPRIPTRPLTLSGAWQDKHQLGSSGTLESIVNQATCFLNPSFDEKALSLPYFSPGEHDLVPWLSHNLDPVASAAQTVDALVPLCSNINNNNNNISNNSEPSTAGLTLVESCSAGLNRRAGKRSRRAARQVPVMAQDWSTGSEYSANSSRRQQATDDTCTERDQGTTAFTSTSTWSPDNTSPDTPRTGDVRDSIYHSRSIKKDDRGVSGGNKKHKGSKAQKRSRSALIHNQSERRRRDRINQRMKTLQKLVPNASKTDKASMLDEVIEYVKQLQAQVSMVSRLSMPQMMMPMALSLQAALQMSMMVQMGMGMGMGGGMLDMSAATMAAGRAAGMQPFLHPSAFMPMPSAPWEAGHAMMPTFLACQQPQPMTMDAYRMMASFCQQMQQAQQASNSKC